MSKVAAIQMTSGADVARNLENAHALLRGARQQDATVVVLPENFAFMGRGEAAKLDVAEEAGQEVTSLLEERTALNTGRANVARRASAGDDVEASDAREARCVRWRYPRSDLQVIGIEESKLSKPDSCRKTSRNFSNFEATCRMSSCAALPVN